MGVLFLCRLGRGFLLLVVSDRHENMAGPLGNAIASALCPRLEALERHGLLHEDGLHLQLVDVGAVVVLGVGDRRFQHLLDDVRPLLRTEGEQIEGLFHGEPADLVGDEPPLLGRKPHPVQPRAGFHVFSLLLLAARRGGGRCRGGAWRRGPRRRRSSRRPRPSAARSRGRSGLQKLLVRHAVALENSRQGEFAQLVPHHVLRDVHRDVLLAVVDRDGQPDEIRQNRGAPRPGLDRALVVCRARRADLLHQMVVHEGTLLDRASHGLALVSFLVPELDDHAARALVLACLVALGQHPPWTHRMLPRRGLSLTAAMRVVDRIHRDAAHGGSHAAPAHAPGLADRFQAVLLVADFADRRAAFDVHFANLPGTQAHLGVAPLAGAQLHRSPCRARKLRAPAGLHFHAVNGGSDRDVPQRQGIARFDRRLRTRHVLRAGREALGRDDIAALAIGVAKQREVRAPVRIVLEPLDLGRNTVLVAAKIDDAVMMFVAATLVAHRDVPVDIAAGLLRLLLDQAMVRPALVQIGIDQLDELAPAGRGGFDFDERHGLLLSLKADFLLLAVGPRQQRDVGFFPVAAAPFEAPEALVLAFDVGNLDRFHLGLEHQLDRRLDLGFGRIRSDAEHVLVVLLADKGAFLRDLRCEQYLHQALFVHGGAHFRISSNRAIAFFVRMTCSNWISETGSAWFTSSTRTFTRLREDSNRFWSRSSVITSAESKPIFLSFRARSFVFGASTLKLSTSFRRSSRASCDRIEHIPARYILRFTFWEKFSSGEFGKILPPPRHSGLATSPARARPVPFWRQGFLCEWRTSLRPFCARVPRRAFAL